MAMNKMNLTYEDTESGVNLTRHKSYFNEAAADYLSVQRKTADIESLIATIQKKDTGINPYMIMYCATLLKEAVITKLSAGNAVDVFGLGTFYLIAYPQKDDESKTTISVNFTPSQEARDAVSGVDISTLQQENTDPVITGLKNLYTKQEGDVLSAGYSVRVSGTRLRIAGDEAAAGVFFAPCTEDGTYNSAGADWIQIKESAIETNRPTALSFFLPSGVTAGTYRLIIKTSAGAAGSRINKTLVRTALYGSVVTVV